MITEKTWIEFRDLGMLWWINMILHTFGWAIIYVIEDDGSISKVYPARVKFRGFNEKTNIEGYIRISQYLNDNSGELLKESEE